MQLLEDSAFVASEIANELKASDQGIIFSPNKAKRVIGTVSDIQPIVERLMLSQKTKKKSRFPELSDSISKIINDKYISQLSSEGRQRDAQHMYPNLSVSVERKRASRKRSGSPKQHIRSPVRTRAVAHAKRAANKQSGLGRILKINFNKWNQLLS
jgi:hypothetical protein